MLFPAAICGAFFGAVTDRGQAPLAASILLQTLRRFARHGTVRQRNPAGKPRRGNAPLVPRLRHERDRGARPAGRARRPEAGAPARAVRDARVEQRLEPALREVRAHRRRGARQVPPARRLRHLRGAGAHGAGLLHALHADRRPGQLRLDRRRLGRGLPLHRVPAGAHLLGAAGRHRQGNGRFRPQLRRQGDGADGAADAHPEPADQRLLGHRGRHGDQHPAAQPGRGGRRGPGAARQSRHQHRRADRDHPGAGFPHGRHHLRPRRRAPGLPHRPRPRDHARAHPFRGHGKGQPPGDHRRRAALPGQQEEPARAHRRAGEREEARRHQRNPRRVRQVGHARGVRTEARRAARSGAQQPVQADPAAGHLRHQHGGAGRRPAAPAEPEADARCVPRAPARGGDAAHRVRTAQGARARPHPRRPGGGAVQRRRDHRADQAVADAARGQAGADGEGLALAAGGGDARARRGRRFAPRRPGARISAWSKAATTCPTRRRRRSWRCACSASPAWSRTRSCPSTRR